MRKIIAITQLSLDGVMQSPGGPEEDPRHGFDLGGWAMPFGDATLHQVLNATIAEKFDLLLGRRTYDIWAGYWPQHGDNPIGAAFNRVTKYVVTQRRKTLDWEKSQRVGGNVVRQIRQIKATKGPDLHVWGSGDLLQTLMAAGLVDEHRLWIVPLVLGKGKRLFEKGLPLQRFTLTETLQTSTRVLINTYQKNKNA